MLKDANLAKSLKTPLAKLAPCAAVGVIVGYTALSNEKALFTVPLGILLCGVSMGAAMAVQHLLTQWVLRSKRTFQSDRASKNRRAE